MRTIRNRIAALEAARPTAPLRVHRVIVEPGQSEDAALDAYGREHIAPADLIILRPIVEANVA